MHRTPAASYDSAVTIQSELERARHLAFAANEIAAKELLLSLGSDIEQGEGDDLLLEVFAQLGEIYLVRTAYNGVEECLRRMREILAVYSAIRAGTNPEAAARVTMSDAEIDRMICRYSRRAQFLQTGLAAAAHGDHEAAEAALSVLTDDTCRASPISPTSCGISSCTRRSYVPRRSATMTCTCGQSRCGRR